MKLGPGVILVLMIIVKILPDVLEKQSKKVDKLERRAVRGAVAEEKIGEVVGFKPWIISVIVFTNAFVEAHKPIKGVSVINKKFLRQFIQSKSKSSPQNLKVWEKRGEIEKLLSS